MLKTRASDRAFTRYLRARIFNLCLRGAAFFLVLAGKLCGREGLQASAETGFSEAKMPENSSEFNNGWQGQAA
jgi:hypothetical protein